jgi:membrane-bound serine protease (ClpP class)
MDQTLILAYVLIATGVLMLVTELIFPSGVLFVLSLAAVAIGVALTFSHGTTIGFITLACVGLGMPALIGTLFHYWPRTSVGRRMFLSEPKNDATMASLPENLELEQLRGRVGRAVSALRPAGITDFDGRRVDTITEGIMVEPGQFVRCVDVRVGKVIVRPVEALDVGILEKMNLE